MVVVLTRGIQHLPMKIDVFRNQPRLLAISQYRPPAPREKAGRTHLAFAFACGLHTVTLA